MLIIGFSNSLLVIMSERLLPIFLRGGLLHELFYKRRFIVLTSSLTEEWMHSFSGIAGRGFVKNVSFFCVAF